MQRPPQNAGFADSGGVYAALCSPLFVQADLVGDHRDELTIRGFAAEVVKRVISSFILCSFSILSLNRAINFMVLVGSLSIIYCAHIILQKSPSGKVSGGKTGFISAVLRLLCDLASIGLRHVE